jgi:hypothetical protein
MITLNDVRKAKRASDWKLAVAEAKTAETKKLLSDNLHIGVLVRKGKTVYYSYANGNYSESKSIADLI